jgi:carbon storage regulator CsrA
MLILSRKAGEKLVIAECVTVTVLEVLGNRIRIGIEAPDRVRVLRGELAGAPESPGLPPAQGGVQPCPPSPSKSS